MSYSIRSSVRVARRSMLVALTSAALVGGCVQVLGLEEWKDPIGSGRGGGDAGGGGSTTSGGGTATISTGGHEPIDPHNPTCADGVKNGLETDIDCGGDACAPCENGLRCENDADCAGHGCVAGRCETSDGGPCVSGPDPTCHDCEKNGLETDVDCGGDACLPCGAGLICNSDYDCMSSRCLTGRCAPGGRGEPCRAATDCASASCVAGGCWSGLCCE